MQVLAVCMSCESGLDMLVPRKKKLLKFSKLHGHPLLACTDYPIEISLDLQKC